MIEDMESDRKFLHRPISITVDEVSEMEAVRTMPAQETFVLINVKLNNKNARALAKMLLEKVLADGEEVVDLVTFSLMGTLK